MKIIVEKATGSVVDANVSDDKVKIPGTNDVVYVKGEALPVDIGSLHVLIDAIDVKDAINPDTHKAGDVVYVVNPADWSATATVPAVALTTKEVEDKASEDDAYSLREGGKDIALVLTELVDYLLKNTAMSATDFSPNVKQAYQDLKAVADRVKGR